jgi:hypothetical protein
MPCHPPGMDAQMPEQPGMAERRPWRIGTPPSQIEAWGRGIEKITNTCKEWGKPEPFCRIRPNEVMIGFNTESITHLSSAEICAG